MEKENLVLNSCYGEESSVFEKAFIWVSFWPHSPPRSFGAQEEEAAKHKEIQVFKILLNCCYSYYEIVHETNENK